MAKAIEPTPVLKGKDAEEFIRLTKKAEKTPDPERAKFLKECLMLYVSHRF